MKSLLRATVKQLAKHIGSGGRKFGGKPKFNHTDITLAELLRFELSADRLADFVMYKHGEMDQGVLKILSEGCKALTDYLDRPWRVQKSKPRKRENLLPPLMVFDWVKAAGLLARHWPAEAWAGVGDGMWDETASLVWDVNGPVLVKKTVAPRISDRDCRPMLAMGPRTGGKVVECFKLYKDEPGWVGAPWWPRKAIKLLHNRPEPSS